jgi:hypothetical protein
VKARPWPAVISEEETLRLVAEEGRSLARYGDGEFKLCYGGSIKSQVYDPALGKRLREILLRSGDCLVGIPNLAMPTKPFWDQFRSAKFTQLFDIKRVYASSFVSRPDSAPWVQTPAYWRRVESLWKGKSVTLVRGSGKSLTASILSSARSVNEILCPRQHAWAEHEALLERISQPVGRQEVALLCCGPTATVLAVELAARGVQAVDLGHIGMWFKRLDMSTDAALQAGRAEAL